MGHDPDCARALTWRDGLWLACRIALILGAFCFQWAFYCSELYDVQNVGYGYWFSKGGRVCEVSSVYFWVFVLCLLFLPALRRKYVERCALVRLAKGLCPKCGYDVRVTPERCSECGAVLLREGARIG